MATLARASSTFAAAISRCACVSRNSISDATFRLRKVSLFFRFTSARRACASACFRVAWASASESSLLFEANSNRRSPLFTTCPAVKLILLKSPSRRGATSASRAAATIPLYSRMSGAACCWPGACASAALKSATSVTMASIGTQRLVARMIVLLLRDSIEPRRLAEERRAELRRPLLRAEVHVHQSETIAETCIPLEIVHRAPLEVALHRNAICDRPLKLIEVSAKKHDAVGVINLAVVSNDILRRAAVLGDVDFFRVPEGLHELRGPVHRLRPHSVPAR